MKRERPVSAKLIPLSICSVVTFFMWSLAAVLWFSHREIGFAVSMFTLGLSLGPLLSLYPLGTKTKKQKLRRLVLSAGGISILSLSLLGAMNLDLEGFFVLLLSGTMGVAVGHTVITIIVGPLAIHHYCPGKSYARFLLRLRGIK